MRSVCNKLQRFKQKCIGVWASVVADWARVQIVRAIMKPVRFVLFHLYCMNWAGSLTNAT